MAVLYNKNMNQTLRPGRTIRNSSWVYFGKAVAVTAFLFIIGDGSAATAVHRDLWQRTECRQLNESDLERGLEQIDDQEPVKPKPAPEPVPAEQQDQKPSAPPKPGSGKDRQEDLDAESIRIDSTLVVVPVSVTDKAGQPIRDLTAEDFILEEEGVRQQVQTLGDPGKTPIELALLFDVSRSIRNRFEFERTAAARFLEVVLKSGDFASLHLIGRQSRLLMDRTGSAEGQSVV